MSSNSLHRVGASVLAVLFGVAAKAALDIPKLPPAASHRVDFAKEIRPLLQEHCFKCHGPDKQKSGLRLDLKAAALKGGTDHAPDIVPGKSAESPLIHFVAGLDKDVVMPPEGKGERLTAQQVGLLRAWIDQGATWPENDAGARDPRLDHWAWQPVKRPEIPPVKKTKWPRNEIDRFILARLEQRGLQPSPEADCRTLIRRLNFDLLGLPPTPEEVDAFVKDAHADAYEKLVERLLASPQYGEHWARHWLDIAHYADTHGFERDQRRDNAWRYRDWVIAALNTDTPYNDFLRDQIAGDIVRPDDANAVVATGFLVAGPWDYVGQVETASPILKRAARADDLDDMVTQVMTAGCGVTINCARCHDHKIDPISQREYYSLWAVFAGVKRGEREFNVAEMGHVTKQSARLKADLDDVLRALATLQGQTLDLADIVGGGNGAGNGRKGDGLDPRTGARQTDKLEFLNDIKPNTFAKVQSDFIDGVFVPDGGPQRTNAVPISSTGLTVTNVPPTSHTAWDAIRNGPVNRQDSTKIADTDFNTAGHSLLGLHANAAITFDLAALRRVAGRDKLRFRAEVGYGGRPADGATFADAWVFVDGELRFAKERLGPKSERVVIDLPLAANTRFLTLMSTDGGNGIGYDQVFFGDPRIEPADAVMVDALQAGELKRLETRRAELDKQIHELPGTGKTFAIVAELPPVVHVLKRGDPEQPQAEVAPGTIHCVSNLSGDFGSNETPEGQRRRALAEWIVNPANPLTRRVIVNRLWHYHFGAGIVDTPSDFGLGGGKPTHPELLDWLAEEFAARGWSLKAIHRLIVNSATYRQQSRFDSRAAAIDADNRLLWRMSPRRLEAESLRDAVLSVSGSLNRQMFGPGYRDFDYKEEYAPVYGYITPDSPELWRRSIYRFAVRSTPQPFMTTLDCPNPANLTPARTITTTALQSLALLNNDFMLRQAAHFADRITREAGPSRPAQIGRAFQLAFGRAPLAAETRAADELLSHGGDLTQLCRMLFNANEFVYVD